MSTWSETPVRTALLRGGAATTARTARMDSDLRSTPFASAHVVDGRLTDPHLQAVVADAMQVAVEQGHAQGHAEGYAAGRAAAAAEAQQERRLREQDAADSEARRDASLAAALDLLESVAAALQAREAVAVAEVERAVVDLALDVAGAVLERELALRADPGRDALLRALELAPEGAAVVARLHPDDLAVLQDVPTAGRALELVPDPAVERGGCLVDTAGRRIDAQVGPALERVAAVLR